MSKPNIIVFFTDQQRHDTTGVHGNPMGLTPNFDRIARSGTHLYHSFSTQPLCGPARATMQTGQFSTQTGVFRNGITLSEDAETMAKVFNRNGYSTGYIGKWHLGGADPVPKNMRGGYQSWLGANLVEHISDAYDAILFDEDGNPKKLPGYRVDAVTDAAIRYCNTHQDDPFMLFVSLLEPHHQNHIDDYPAPDGYREACAANLWTPPDLMTYKGTSPWQLSGYYGMVKRIDEAFGRLMDALKSLDMLDNTIVLFTTDHGCHFKTRNDEYKRACHESAVRIPTLITGPGFNAGGQVRGLFGTVDVAPTLIDAAGLEVPNSMVGKSVLPLVRDARAPWRQDLFFQISETETGRALRTHRWKYGVTSDYDRHHAGAEIYRESYLYDLDTDPYELVNLIGMAPFRELADQLKERLLAWIAEVEDGSRPVIENAAEVPAGQHRLKATDLMALQQYERLGLGNGVSEGTAKRRA
ncbi:arylsulfatase [Marinobacterium aestuarii]|uniref:Arylsulfatase n=1 Tax=Marinobacterium aestuarii TaxID=1821621 RepID=A0A1A9F0T3_9GAMM|nr:sulfatase-like hydrolase/transferase [Marinobacterium aestuarii]ANG63478.1 arylsulfatase [Marinobacterium aestuarii]